MPRSDKRPAPDGSAAPQAQPGPDVTHTPGPTVGGAPLSVVLAEFAFAAARSFLAPDIMGLLARSVTEVIDLDGVGVMTMTEDGQLRVVTATQPAVDDLERLQEALQDGPCQHSLRLGLPVNIADLDDEGAWPAYQQLAADRGIKAVTAIPLTAGDRSWGVLDLYRTRAQRLTADELAAAQVLAELAASYLVLTSERDVARAAHSELAHQAMHDPLTALPVRWVYDQQLITALSRLDHGSGGLAVLFIDLDRLKEVNDTYGHHAGDRFIITCAERIRAALRPEDRLARVGGDEFLVLLEDIHDIADAERVSTRIHEHLTRPHLHDGHTLHPSASIGISTTRDHLHGPDLLITHADAAMYAAKHTGGAHTQVYCPAGHETSPTRRPARPAYPAHPARGHEDDDAGLPEPADARDRSRRHSDAEQVRRLAGELRRREQQFAEALASRDLIGQAKGLLMERYHLTPDTAFAVLVRHSRDSNRRLRDVAAELLSTGGLPHAETSAEDVQQRRTRAGRHGPNGTAV